jgi:hypothetical protein
MTDTMHEPEEGRSNESSADETFSWSPDPESSTTGAGPQAREWLAQLQAMIENLATQAGPVVREVGAKAAELAAIAGEKAGPVAHRAAELTGQAGQMIAERSRDLAAELRRDQAMRGESTPSAEPAESTDESDTIGTPPTAAGVG